MSTISGSDNNAYWYPVRAGTYHYYLINKGSLNYCLAVNSSGSGVSYSSGDNKWGLKFVGLDVPLIKQEPDLCGPCSTLQIITYQGKENLITGASQADKQNTLNNSPYNCISCYNICYETLSLSQFGFSNDYKCYTYKHHPDYNSWQPYPKLDNIDEVRQYIYDSLQNGQPVILLTFNTGAFGYYHNQMYDHFLCIVGYNNGYYITRDCNNLNKVINGTTYEFFGEHIVSENELSNAIFYSNNYGWINCAMHNDINY